MWLQITFLLAVGCLGLVRLGGLDGRACIEAESRHQRVRFQLHAKANVGRRACHVRGPQCRPALKLQWFRPDGGPTAMVVMFVA